jgi:hypothetical protein
MAKTRRKRSRGRRPSTSRRPSKNKLQRQVEVRKAHLKMQLAKVRLRIREARKESNQAIRAVQSKYNVLLRGLERQGKKLELRFRLLANKTDLAFSDFRLGLSRAGLDINRAVKKAVSEFRKAR